MSGLKLAACYSFPPYKLGLCGPSGKKSRGRLATQKILKQFKSAYCYYKLIAKSNNIKNIFNKRVIKAYWIGNELLEKVSLKDFKNLVSLEFNLPEKAKLITQKNLAHHNAHVELIGSVAGRIKFNEKLKKLCKISYREVNHKFYSYHWGERCAELSPEDLKNLKKYG